MTLHDPFVRSSLGGWTKRVRRRLGRRGHVPRGRGQAASGAPVRQRYRRQLSRIERNLAADAPPLKSMFEMFNQLNEGERLAGVERVPPPAWPPIGWPRPPAYVAVLLALAAVMTMCLILSTQVHSAVRPCAATSAPSPGTATAPVRPLGCPAYATTDK